jgi:hypothetical protein
MLPWKAVAEDEALLALVNALALADGGERGPLVALGGAGGPARSGAVASLTSVGLWFWGARDEPGNIEPLAVIPADPVEREAAARAALLLARGAMLAFDGAALARWARVAGEAGGGGGTALAIEARAAAAWSSLFAGEPDRAVGLAAELFTEASAQKVPGIVIDMTALRALAALERGDMDDATDKARRAGRMAAAEGLRAPRALAGLVLARVRRRTGRPHLAARILTALAPHVAPVWLPWLGWESLLAGAEPGDHGTGSRAATAMTAAADLIGAARAGDRATFEDAGARLRQLVAGLADAAREAEALICAVDPARAPAPLVEAWRSGREDILRLGSYAIGERLADAAPVGEGDAPLSVFVVARPGEPGRRVLRLGLGLWPGARQLAPDGRSSSRAFYRTDTGLSVLALAAPAGVETAAFFAQVYGVSFSHERHANLLNVLLHRMRERLAGSGAIERSGDGLTLNLNEPVSVPDPRCVPAATARLLWVLGQRPKVTTADVAGQLGVTIRSAQSLLRQLVEEGACQVRRVGRNVEYHLEDTTFSEPTRTDVTSPVVDDAEP